MESYGYSLVDNTAASQNPSSVVTVCETLTANVVVNITLPTIGSLELKEILEKTLRTYSLSDKDVKIIILTILIRRPAVKMERDGSRTLTFNHSVTWTYSSPYPVFYQNVIFGRRRYHGEFGAPTSKKLGMVTISGTVFGSRRNHDTLDGISELLLRDHSSTLKALDIQMTSGVNPGLVINGASPPPYAPTPSAPPPEDQPNSQGEMAEVTGVDMPGQL